MMATLSDLAGVDSSKADWSFRFWTQEDEEDYIAWQKGGELYNAHSDGKALHIEFRNHGLGPGRLKAELSMTIPSACGKGQEKRIVKRIPTDVVLSGRGGDELVRGSLIATLPVICINVDEDIERMEESIEANSEWLRREVGQMISENESLREEVNKQIAPGPLLEVESDKGVYQVMVAGACGRMSETVRGTVSPEPGLAPVVVRGVIPLQAEPGSVYRNMGYIKLTKGNKDAEYDLSEYISGYAEKVTRVERYGDGDGGFDIEGTVLRTYYTEEATRPYQWFRIYVDFDSRYLWKNPETGLIEDYYGMAVEQALEPPRIPGRCTSVVLDSVINDIRRYSELKGLKVQLQKKTQRKYSQEGDGPKYSKSRTWKNRPKHWASLTGENVGGCFICGLYRIRYVGKKGRVSPWVTFSAGLDRSQSKLCIQPMDWGSTVVCKYRSGNS